MIKLKQVLNQQMMYSNLLKFKDQYNGVDNLLSTIASLQNQLKYQKKNFKQDQQFKTEVYTTIINILNKLI